MQKIIIFDSGIGGFSVLREVVSQNLPVSVTYCADQANFPYGDKSEVWLTDRMQQVARWASSLDPAAFVVACNTATVSSVAVIRSQLTVPVIGVEPVVKPLASYARALVLATQVTAQSQRTQDLIREFGPHVTVEHAVGLAGAIENNDQEQVKMIITSIADRVKRQGIEAIGLSCTHYPLISHELSHLLPDVHIFDPSPAVVYQLKKTVPTVVGKVKTEMTFLTTGSVVRFKEQVVRYFGNGYDVGAWNI